MPATYLLPLWAVHISDGILTWPWLTGGFAVAAVLAVFGSWRIQDEEIPQVAVLTAVFFIASQIHVRVPPSSVHLLLNGLLGLVLGRRAALAIPVGLFLQAALFSHGGFTTLGINSCVMVLPALLAWQLFGLLQGISWVRHGWGRSALVAISVILWLLCLLYGVMLLLQQTRFGWRSQEIWQAMPLMLAVVFALGLAAAWLERRLDHAPEFPLGLLIGQVSVLATTFLNCLVLAWGGQESWQTLAQIVFVAHLPVAVVEGIILGFTVGFLARVKPEMLRWAPPEEAQCPADVLS
ncbi:MAG TPA: CbiM family transporter [Gemmataceae bacterium]|jgi:cobalt/nickel transport system permease protein|nr:CbiM family transporter [Gemmataceae bacterium]